MKNIENLINETLFIQLINQLDTTLDIAYKTITNNDKSFAPFKSIPVNALLEKDFKLNPYLEEIFDDFDKQCPDDCADYIESLVIPDYITDDELDEYLYNAEREYVLYIKSKSGIAYELVMDNGTVDDSLCTSIIKTLYFNYTFDKDYDNEYLDRIILDYNKVLERIKEQHMNFKYITFTSIQA